jgi:multidrug efflux pump subunit AcrA (membrane-fusion protein)
MNLVHGTAGKRRVLIGATAAGILILALGAWLRAGARAARGGDGETVLVVRRTFATAVAAVGAVKPQIGAEVKVGSRISGRVQRLRANIGDRVRKGDVMAELETAELDALIAERKAGLQVAEARLSAVEAAGPQEVARAEAAVARFEATGTLAREEWERQQALLKDRASTIALAEAARERHLVAEAELQAARHTLSLARSGSTEGRKQALAERERARAALQGAMVERAFTVIRSPISGVVASVSTQEGETVAAGLSAPTFLTVVDLERLQVHAYVDEVDIGKVAAGQPVAFTVDAFPSREFSGRVEAIYPSATLQDNVVKYVVTVMIAGEYGGYLRPEMTASVRIDLQTRSVLAVPVRAVRREGGKSVVFVQDDGRTVTRPVRVGWRDGPWIEIIDGVREGERVLLDPPPAPAEPNR